MAGTLVAGRTAEPSVVTPGRSTRVRSRVQVQWLVLAAALTVLAGVLVAWGLGRAADRIDVVSLARPVPAGAVIGPDDLGVTPVAFDGRVTGLVPAASLDRLVGRVATVDLEAGGLLVAGMWADGSGLGPDETLVGAVLDAGRFPGQLAQGTTAWAVPLDDTATAQPVLVRVVESDRTDSAGLSITMAVARTDSVRLAQLAASEQLVLIGLPPAPSEEPVP
jgi:hypothetical protein